MYVYLPGPQGPDQLATKWLLKERGYHVTCATDVASVEYDANRNMAPTPAEFRQRQMYEMMRADVVVLEEEMMENAGDVLFVMHACRFAGLRVVRYEDLPVQAPSLCRQDEILEERDLLMVHTEPLSKRLRTHVKAARARLERWAQCFDEKCGWFFTNGNKTVQAAPRPYTKRDMMGDASGATVPNEEAISAHYKKAWMEQCAAVMNTNEPVELDVDAMEKWIAAQLREREQERQMDLPLHQLLDLEPMGFKLVQLLRGGPLWASTECAVWMPAGGDTHVWVRGQSQRPEMFILMLDGDVQNGQPDVQAPDYTWRELMGLLQSMRRQRPAHPAESWLNEAREALHKLERR